METEEWRPVIDCENYEVSSFGRVRSMPGGNRKGQLLAPDTAGVKYARVTLYRDGKRWRRRIHLLVAAAFLGPRPLGSNGLRLDVCHNDGNDSNNRADNLRFDTRNSNTRDQVEHGVHLYGGRTKCGNGHPYTPSSTTIVDAGIGSDGQRRHRRSCKTCVKQWQATSSARKRAAI